MVWQMELVVEVKGSVAIIEYKIGNEKESTVKITYHSIGAPDTTCLNPPICPRLVLVLLCGGRHLPSHSL